MADKSVDDATLSGDTCCDKPTADSEKKVTQEQGEPFAQFIYTFDSASETRLEDIEEDLSEALIDIADIKKKLCVMQDVFSGGVAVENIR